MKRRAATLRGFAPIARADARLLILGSMPGGASLAARQYYAHPRNAFWPVIEAVWGIPRSLPYVERVREVSAQGIAIWDVLQRCRRHTSLDADIDAASVVVNDFARFLRRHAHLRQIVFNGGSAEVLYRRHVLPALPQSLQQIPRLRMPSTSPAHASLRLAAKVDAWGSLRRYTDPARH
ncbi:MAG TPA: DNA-deoxyinosine glycosylase [Steroidobacteraceae bacterium]|nr:DNA-deoxyinosine glycosylase [Steroidobacteraceae bacterium]